MGDLFVVSIVLSSLSLFLFIASFYLVFHAEEARDVLYNMFSDLEKCVVLSKKNSERLDAVYECTTCHCSGNCSRCIYAERMKG